jgi:hypothetical protein
VLGVFLLHPRKDIYSKLNNLGRKPKDILASALKTMGYEKLILPKISWGKKDAIDTDPDLGSLDI